MKAEAGAADGPGRGKRGPRAAQTSLPPKTSERAAVVKAGILTAHERREAEESARVARSHPEEFEAGRVGAKRGGGERKRTPPCRSTAAQRG
jgi:hypothetical protein